MSKNQILAVLIVGAMAIALPACGGGGTKGFSVPDNSVLVTSTTIPPMLSGECMEYAVEIAGGCGGPYVLRLIDGRLPDGCELVNEPPSIQGCILEDGAFDFEIIVDDTGCTPFSSTTARFSMDVGMGDLTVADVLSDGEPSLEGPGFRPDTPVYPSLPTVVYNDFVSLEFVIAGGRAPYSMAIYDLPGVDDGSLPLGTSIPVNSTSVVGSPAEVGPDGGPFLLTFRVRDSLGNETYFTCHWMVDTPAIIITTTDLPDGVCGVGYSGSIITAEGVPPFTHELVESGLPAGYSSDRNPNPSNPGADVIYNPGGPPDVNPPEALVKIDETYYPDHDEFGPDYTAWPTPPEGVYLIEEFGAFSGVARRRGAFMVNYHVQSTLVGNNFGQHAWASYPVNFTEAAGLAHDPTYLFSGSFGTSPPPVIPDAELGTPYSLQLLGLGGVPKDGYTDAPHYMQRQNIEGSDPDEELPGTYDWEAFFTPPTTGFTGMELIGYLGEWRTTSPGGENLLVPQLSQPMDFEVIDQSLPTQLLANPEHRVRETVTFGIGPDKVIFTESSRSFTTSSNQTPMNDTTMTVRALLAYQAGAQPFNLDATRDLVGTGLGQIPIPPEANQTDLAKLLTSIDITRVSVNPTGWWDDMNGLHPKAARPMQSGDMNYYYSYYGASYNGTTTMTSGSTSYKCEPSTTCVGMPYVDDTLVTHDPANGVYNDGGKLYVFDSASYFGIFILRQDAKIYVPAAFNKTFGDRWLCFGDNWTKAYSTSTTSLNNYSLGKIPQMTMSPDGRTAAFKLRDSLNQYEYAYNSAILLISLTGERRWNGQPYKIIGNGATSTSYGYYQVASSLTLTNDHLYYLTIDSSTYGSWNDHHIFRYEVDGVAPNGALLQPTVADPNWTNKVGTTSGMQTPFQEYNGTYGRFYYGSYPSNIMNAANGHNGWEFSAAPHPFRVNFDGNACAILASPRSASEYASSLNQKFHVWVDFEGDLRRISTQARYHRHGGGRGTKITEGPGYYSYSAGQFGDKNGPTTALEISDDGTKVAAVCSRESYVYGSYRSTTTQIDYYYREDIYAWEANGPAGAPWSVASTETCVTGSRTGYEGTSNSPGGGAPFTLQNWKFGGLTFTRAADGFVFWAGYCKYSPTIVTSSFSSGYYNAKSFEGSLYAFRYSDKKVWHILPAAIGGANKPTTVPGTQAIYSYSTGSWNPDGGRLRPRGGFLSQDGNFWYIVDMMEFSGTVNTQGRLVGVNVRSLDNTQSINGHNDGTTFAPGGWLSGYAFTAVEHYYGSAGMGMYNYSSSRHAYYGPNHGNGMHAVAQENGRVFFLAGYQYYSSTYTSPIYGMGSNPRTYGYGRYLMHVFCFDPNVGGDIQRVSGSEFGATSGSTYAPWEHLEVRPDGSAVAATQGTGSYYNTNNREKAYLYTSIALDADGDMQPGKVATGAVTSASHVSSSFAIDASGKKLYIANGTGNENQKTMKTVAEGGTPVAVPTLPPKNYSVLQAGR